MISALLRATDPPLGSDDRQRAVRVLEAVCRMDATQETAVARLLTLHAHTGAVEDVIRVWLSLIRASDDIGAAPSAQLIALHRQLTRGSSADRE